MMHGIRTQDPIELMQLARQAQERGCFATSEAILKELARRGPTALEQAA
jgi:hypothetical protein